MAEPKILLIEDITGNHVLASRLMSFAKAQKQMDSEFIKPLNEFAYLSGKKEPSKKRFLEQVIK